MSGQCQLVCYVIAQPGLNLDAYANRYVDLYGQLGYRSETVRAYFLSASYAKPVQ